MNHIIQAAKDYFGVKRFEEWLDDNSYKLNLNVSSLEEAKGEILRVQQEKK